MMSKLILSLGILIGYTQAHAYITAQMGEGYLNPHVRTHILVAGSGNELDDLFQQTLTAKAKKFKEMYPNEQVYVFMYEEKPNGDETNIQKLVRWGFSNVKSNGSSLGSDDFMDELLKFYQIASIDVYSHATFYYGIQLDGWLNRLDASDEARNGSKPLGRDDDGFSKLQGHFAQDAFAILHGCNTGFMATILYQRWKIPVAGSFTGTDFQYLYSDGEFYWKNTDEKGKNSWPTTGSFKKVNDQSFKNPVSCSKSGCIRLKPDSYGYYGYWGEHADGGLPYFKFFCSKTIGEAACKRGMAKAALSFVTNVAVDENSSLADYKKAVQDMLCPNEVRKPTLKSECVAALEKSLNGENLSYNPAFIDQIQCSMSSCKVTFNCEYIPLVNLLMRGKCEVIRDPSSTKATTLTSEYNAYIDGYKFLHP